MKTKLNLAIFLFRGFLPAILHNCAIHIHALAVYIKERLPFACDPSLENSDISYLCFPLALLHSVPYFFFQYTARTISMKYNIISSIHTNFQYLLTKFICFSINFVKAFLSVDFYYIIYLIKRDESSQIDAIRTQTQNSE